MKKLSSVLLLLLFVISAFTQSLPRSIPEAEGISSAAIIRFIDSYQKAKHELHSVMIIRHGKVITEGWWSPYRADLKHSMYSVSKSWTSTAVGFAVDERKLSVNDKVISFFPEYAGMASKPYIADLKVKDLLTMSVGHEKEQFENVFMQQDWAKGFLQIPVVNVPGTKFLYNTLATYMLSAIVQKVTGQTVIDYLQPRLFAPLNISGIDWEVNYKGINTGGWGIRVKTEDMAKLGLLYLNHGQFNGQQILSADWVIEATGKQIEQSPAATQSQKDSSDWLQGYGYQFWRCRHNAFRADGAFGQYVVMMPEQDAVVVITSESLDLQDDLNMIWKYLLPAFQTGALKPDRQSVNQLKKKTSHLKLDPPVSSFRKGDQHLLNTKFALTANIFDFTDLTVQKNKKHWSLLLGTKDKKTHLIPPEFQSCLFALLKPFQLASSCRLIDEQTLEITVRYMEGRQHRTMTMKLEEEQLKLKVINSYNPAAVIEIKGTA